MADALTSAQRQELKNAFDVFDSDGSGKISEHELGNVFKALNVSVNHQQLERLLAEMDSDGSGEVEFNEFCRVMAASFFKKYSEDELRRAFRQFDEDNSGYIQASELEHIMRKLGRPFSRTQIEAVINSLDRSGDGKLGFEEFIELFK